MPSYLVTGSNRGLGLSFVAELLKNKDNTVIATARDAVGSSSLQELKAHGDNTDRLQLINLDLSKPETIRAAAKQTESLLPGGLDYLISNAGVNFNGLKTFDELDLDAFTAELNFTVTAPLLLVREFLPLVLKGNAKKILIVSSALGSIHAAFYLPNLANGYSVSRAALNMLARKWSPTLKAQGVTMAMIHPGWAPSTEVGSGITEWVEKYNPEYPRITPEQSAADCVKVLNGLTIEDSGAFLTHEGTAQPF